ncbi:MAG: hypothetical protein RL094_99 [Candidatus Parcubacteria bacterium]|jgi:methylated-DNA-protein-cysteine methyltransferase-like protein
MNFTEKVYKVVHRIPKGNVATYGQVAKMAGNVRAARAVGMAMSQNKDTKKIPCHRVVSSTGALTGYAFGGITSKKKLLQSEGVVFKKEKVDLNVSLWSGK